MKTLCIVAGAIALALAVAGIVLPLLPTTPFLLLAAALWLRSSPRLHRWLLDHPVFGPYVRNFSENRAIPLRVKIVSVTLVWATMSWCIFAVVHGRLWAQILLALLAAAITWHILSYATLRTDDTAK